MSVESVSAQGFAEQSLDVLRHVTESAREDVRRAAELIADCIRADGVIHAFGTGHSQAMVLEVAGRAGGLVPTNRLQISDLVLYGGDDPSVLDDPLLERQPGVAVRLYDLAAPHPGTCSSSSPTPASTASSWRWRCMPGSRGTRSSRSPPHPHGGRAGRARERKKLVDLADVVLDNAAPVGDALLSLPGVGRWGRCPL